MAKGRKHRQRKLPPRGESLASAVILQLNDVYHIDFRARPLCGDSLILPRVATLKKRIEAGKVPLRFCVPGDFLAPSGLSRRSDGLHMVRAFNALGVTEVTFGNHEFEPLLGVDELQVCIEASDFYWVSSNLHVPKQWVAPTGRVVPFRSIEFQGHIPFRLVLVGITENESKYPFLVDDPLESAHRIEKFVYDEPPEDKPTILVGLTHLYKHDDYRLATECSGFSLIMGGHDHDVAESKLVNQSVVVKTLSNARTIRVNFITLFHHELLQQFFPVPPPPTLDPDKLQKQAATEAMKAIYASTIIPTLARILFQKDKLKDSEKNIVNAWLRECPQKASMGIRKAGNNVWAMVYSLPLLLTSKIFLRHVDEDRAVHDPIEREVVSASWSMEVLTRVQSLLEGEDEVLRSRQGALGSFINQLLLRSFNPAADLAVLNSGAFRIDRNLEAGEEITEKTLHDIFYHDNEVMLFELGEATVLSLLEASAKKRGTGEYLQVAGVPIGDLDVSGTRVLRVVTTKYVADEYLKGFKPTAGTGEIKTVLKDLLRSHGH